MGVFGYGPLDNDDAADILDFWERLDESMSTKNRVMLIYGMEKMNDLKLLALGQLCLSNGGLFKGKFRRDLSSAICSQLESASEWDEPELRRKALKEFQSKLGIKTLPRNTLNR